MGTDGLRDISLKIGGQTIYSLPNFQPLNFAILINKYNQYMLNGTMIK